MRSIKKLTNVFITLILSIILVMSNLFINVHAAENSQIYYLALGDSITAATPGYVEIVANNIGADATINGGCSGVTSYDLYNYIKTNEGARSVIKQANVITLQIGSNDIMCSLLNTILDALGCNDNNRTITGRVIEQKIQLINNKITSMQEQYNNATGFYKLYLGLEMQYNISLINNAVYSTQVIDGYSELYKTNFKGIINEIKKINPTAKIYIGNLYNPYKEISPIKIGSYTVLDVGNIVETWELNYNNIIRNVAKEYPIVDLHSVITSSSQLNGDYDPHPNSVGYQDIANAFLKIMK